MDTFLIENKDAIENVYNFINSSKTPRMGFYTFFLYTAIIGLLISCFYYISKEKHILNYIKKEHLQNTFDDEDDNVQDADDNVQDDNVQDEGGESDPLLSDFEY